MKDMSAIQKAIRGIDRTQIKEIIIPQLRHDASMTFSDEVRYPKKHYENFHSFVRIRLDCAEGGISGVEEIVRAISDFTGFNHFLVGGGCVETMGRPGVYTFKGDGSEIKMVWVDPKKESAEIWRLTNKLGDWDEMREFAVMSEFIPPEPVLSE